MESKRFTLTSAYEEFELPAKSLEGYDSIKCAVDWCYEWSIPLSDVVITEWDLDQVDTQGVPDIIASVNLELAYLDEVEDLEKYIIW